MNIQIPFSKIMIDERMQTRPVDHSQVMRIEEGIGLGKNPPPMLVCPAGKDHWLLLDGHHRYLSLRSVLNGVDAPVSVSIIECADDKERFAKAIETNINQGNNYKPEQIGPLYMRLIHEIGFTKGEARKLLRLTDEHSERIERPLVRMEATSNKEASVYKSSKVFERVNPPGTPEIDERARRMETPISLERASGVETPNIRERANYRDIRFHVERLRKLIPAAWTDARSILDTLASEIIAAMKKESEE